MFGVVLLLDVYLMVNGLVLIVIILNSLLCVNFVWVIVFVL